MSIYYVYIYIYSFKYTFECIWGWSTWAAVAPSRPDGPNLQQLDSTGHSSPVLSTLPISSMHHSRCPHQHHSWEREASTESRSICRTCLMSTVEYEAASLDSIPMFSTLIGNARVTMVLGAGQHAVLVLSAQLPALLSRPQRPAKSVSLQWLHRFSSGLCCPVPQPYRCDTSNTTVTTGVVCAK